MLIVNIGIVVNLDLVVVSVSFFGKVKINVKLVKVKFIWVVRLVLLFFLLLLLVVVGVVGYLFY